jgi:excisionase family DNA binding protein
MTDLMGPEQAAAALGVSRRWVVEAASRGELPGIKLGRNWRFAAADLEDWIDRRRKAARKEAGL